MFFGNLTRVSILCVGLQLLFGSLENPLNPLVPTSLLRFVRRRKKYIFGTKNLNIKVPVLFDKLFEICKKFFEKME